MRYDNGHKRETRIRILKTAAEAVRADGPDRIGVAAVMRQAGMTHGGFYAHFNSKDALVEASIEHMFDEALARAQKRMDGRPPADGLAAYVDAYLSTAHCEARAQGCPLVALAADLPRQSDACRQAYAAGLRRLVQALAGRLADAGYPEPESLARSVLAELVGAVSLARCETDAQRANAMLADARRLLKARLGLEQC
ncbi:TetR/AcrR family transcriptional regulator [Achromobacter marplatensis]|uniref:TetR/AcrR family transcriptional regulator n=1 Tax=Achromobacter marplatensis TaxID=470868 RepID=UPI0028EF45C6|nr:TetR/AcrR family transcriptional regulator [Achromobacter marplatensis]